ncbi:MAG TPA: HIT family protein [Gemmatimonadaceae bacterium]|nr:HIT family protein [Gemmatimonadaceae bacterium]
MSLADRSCTFCDLINGAGEVSTCYEDGHAVAFMDVQPVNAGHVLVVSRRHYERFEDVPPELAMHLFRVVTRLVPAVKRVAKAEGINIVVNSGRAAGQDEPHYHVHVIPRIEGDGFDVPLPFAASEMPDRTLLDATAVRIMTALRDPVGSLRPVGIDERSPAPNSSDDDRAVA